MKGAVGGDGARSAIVGGEGGSGGGGARGAAVRGRQAARHAVEPSSITHCTSMRSPTCHPVESSLKVETHCLGRRLRRAPGATASLHAAQAALRVA